MADNPQTMGQRIRAARQRDQTSQSDLADRIGVSASTVSQWESGKVRGLEPRALRAIARVLEVNEEWLSYGTGPMGSDVAGPVTHVPGRNRTAAVQAEHRAPPNTGENDPARQWLVGPDNSAAKPARPVAEPRNLSICTQCGTVGKPKTTTPGSFFMELILWLCFLVPGLIYSVWRLSARRPTCRTCGAIRSLVPLQSPRGRELAAARRTDTAPPN